MYEAIKRLKQKIESKEELWHYLRVAMEVELSTIPAYLCALYSIKPDHNREAAKIIQSVVIEEMLHMILAGNVLSATGGESKVNDKKFVPQYPTDLPDSDQTFQVPLQRFSMEAIRTFLKIEQPERPPAPPKVEGWHTIGQFYDGLCRGLDELCQELGPAEVFNGDPDWQIRPEDYYGGAGKVVVVTDEDPLKTHQNAKRAFEEIVDQGEGMSSGVFDGDTLPGKGPVPAHYFRFQEIDLGRFYQPGDTPNHPSGEQLLVDWDAVYPMKINPSTEGYDRGGEIWDKLMEFNRTYMRLLTLLQESFTGRRERLMETVGKMYNLKYKAIALMKIPSGDGATTVGPSFEYVAPGE